MALRDDTACTRNAVAKCDYKRLFHNRNRSLYCQFAWRDSGENSKGLHRYVQDGLAATPLQCAGSGLNQCPTECADPELSHVPLVMCNLM